MQLKILSPQRQPQHAGNERHHGCREDDMGHENQEVNGPGPVVSLILDGADLIVVPQITNKKKRRRDTGQQHAMAMLLPFSRPDLDVAKHEKRNAEAVQYGVGCWENFAE